jgi:hypothetical protein
MSIPREDFQALLTATKEAAKALNMCYKIITQDHKGTVYPLGASREVGQAIALAEQALAKEYAVGQPS